MGFRNLNRSPGTPAAAGGGGGGAVNSVGVANATIVKTGTSSDPLFAVVQATVAPLAVGAQALGSSLKSAKEDHAHAHGDQLGGTLHANADGSTAGFMTAANFTKLGGISALAAALTAVAPSPIGTQAVGTGTAAAHEDHVHAHGNQLGGALHANADGSNAGFLTAADFTKLAGVGTAAPPGARTITGASGLAGGGDLSANRTITLDLTASDAWTAAHAWTTTTVPITSTITDASAATQLEAARFRHLSSVTATGGNAVYVSLWATNATPAAAEISRVTAIASVITAGSERGVFVISNATAGVMTPHAWSTLGDWYATSSLSLGTLTLATGVVTAIAKISIVSTMLNFNSNQAANGGFTFTGTTNVSGARQYFVITPSSNTTTTAATEVKFFDYQTHTNQFASNTAVATQREFCIAAPTYAFQTATGTISDAATVYISGAPIAGTNAAITRPVALWIGGGQTREDNIAITAAGGGATVTLGTIGGSGPTTAAQNKWIPEMHDGIQYWRPVWV